MARTWPTNMITVDGAAILSPSGMSWGEADISKSSAGRTTDGTMHKERLTTKVTLSLSWSGLTDAQAKSVLQAFYPEYVTVGYYDSRIGKTSKVFYTGDRKAQVYTWQIGKKIFKSVSFDIIER